MLNRLGTEMKLIEQSIEGLVALEDSLKGEGGNAIRSFYEECHLANIKILDRMLVFLFVSTLSEHRSI